MSFPYVHSERPAELQGKRNHSMLSTFCCKQVCGDIKLGEGMLLGQVYLNTWHIVQMPPFHAQVTHSASPKQSLGER